MAKRIFFRRDLCNRPRRADVDLGTQCQSQSHAFYSSTLQRHQLDCILVFHREYPIRK
jgi:hypothetical protein